MKRPPHGSRELCRTSEGRVSSTRMLGPVASGPKAQMERAASRSQSYLVWKNSPSFFLGEGGDNGRSASSVTAGSRGQGSCLAGGQSPQPIYTVPRITAKRETKSVPRMCGVGGRAGKRRRLSSFSLSSPVPRDLHHLVLDVLGEALLQRLSNHGDLVSS